MSFSLFSLGQEKYKQIKSLCVKRFQIFRQRYLIAFLTLIMPILVVCLAKLIPSGYSIVTATLFQGGNGPISMPLFIYDLDKDWSLKQQQQQQQIIPYTLNVINSPNKEIEINHLKDLIKKHFPFGELLLLNNSNKMPSFVNSAIEAATAEAILNEYVYEQRRENSIYSLLDSYYVGISLILDVKSNELSACLFYNTISFHAIASSLHRFDNLLLDFYTNVKNQNQTNGLNG